MHHLSPKLLLLALVLLALIGGCTGMYYGDNYQKAVAEIRAEQVLEAAKFDHSCEEMQITERLGTSRFKLNGCGKAVVYLCEEPENPDEQRAVCKELTSERTESATTPDGGK